MINKLKQEAAKHGDKLQLISINRLQSIQHEIESFKEHEELNGFQKWIITDLYKFTVPKVEFVIKSILLVALPHPTYARVNFNQHGKEYNFISLVMPDFDNTKHYIEDFLSSRNHYIITAPNLPMKRLAAQSGMAVYGRNNICYIEGMGSDFSFEAYYCDIECDNDNWTSVCQADICRKCRVCQDNCPTGAIRADRFLIDNEKCLSFFNESPGEFPEWLPVSAHHSLYDCLRCQIKCPMNNEYVDDHTVPISFSEEETDMILTGKPYDAFSPLLKEKAKILGFDKWLPAIPRNLRTLIEQSEHII
jgi:epoxyqueuosine reductase